MSKKESEKTPEIRISIRVTAEEKVKWEAVAKKQGMPFAEFVRDSLDLRANFDKTFWKGIMDLSDRHGLPTYLIIQNKIILQQAEYEAEKNVLPRQVVRPLLEYCHTDKGIVTGQELFNMIYNNKVQSLEAELRNEEVTNQDRLASMKKSE